MRIHLLTELTISSVSTLAHRRSGLRTGAKSGATHVANVLDHGIAFLRNDLFPGHWTSEGVDPDLLAQFALAEEAPAALGLVVWSMREFEVDDGPTTAAIRFRDESGVEQILACSPDKDSARLTSGVHVEWWDCRQNILYDEAVVYQKSRVPPRSIPDWLALVVPRLGRILLG